MASFLCILVVALSIGGAVAGHDYGDALSKSILFYEAQRSGALPNNQRVNWRADSGLHDGKANGVDLVGGYYDAGDNVKFGLPMAFTITMLSWSVIEYGKQMASSGELGYATEAIKWGTDYLLKAHPEPDVLYGEVGDGNSDHYCWNSPEDMTTPRQAYRIDANHPGSDLAGETAAAMAAASIVFRRSNPAYSNELLSHSRQLFTFADKYRGKYDSSITVAQKYYGSRSGYADELLWAATWLHEATGEQFYMNYLTGNAGPLGGTGWAMTEFSWDVKYAGVQILASKFLMQGRGKENEAVLRQYQDKAEYFLCACVQKGNQNVQRTPGGLLFWQKWNNIQFVTSASFLISVYSDYLTSAGNSLKCPQGSVQPSELLAFSKSQIDYVLGDNPRATSYMVGYGSNYPRQVHHRASSIVSYKVDSSFVTCRGGYATWFSSKGSDPNVLVGALVGGPDQNDNFADERDNYEQTEPATYNNGPVIGVLARLHGGGGYNQLLPVAVPIQATQPKPSPSSQPQPNPSPSSKPQPPAASASPLVLSQTVTSSWSYRGRTYYRYSTVITNKSQQNVENLKLSIQGLYGPIWGVSKTEDSFYSYPQWLQSLSPGQSFDFVYIHAGPQASISISSYDMSCSLSYCAKSY
uniref:Endoglucanase n=1 Tax=Araucaria cunninghamii TaxID=56994 RepID=A0A0D6R7H6_ARACU